MMMRIVSERASAWRRLGLMVLAISVAQVSGSVRAATVAAATMKAEAFTLPKKLLCGYGGYDVDRDTIAETIKQYLDPMAKAHFNACQFKILSRKLDLANPRQFRRLRELALAAKKRHLTLLLYTYASGYIRQPKRDANLPPFVRADGSVVANRFSLIDWGVWQHMFDGAFQLAHASRKLPIAGVSIDVEIVHNTGVSYDDQAWARFASAHRLDAHVSADHRHAYLQKHQLGETYIRWYHHQLDRIAEQFELQMHKINPHLVLGMMPARLDAFYGPFVRHLATPTTPAIMDSWTMYNGGGFTKHVLAIQKQIKQANANNRFVPWFRVNNYRPADLTHQAYQAAMRSDGYSFWSLAMLRRDWKDRPALYRLPVGYNDPRAYFAAFGKANRQVKAALISGRSPTSIRFVAVKPLAPPLVGIKHMTVPQLTPVGTGAGHPQWLTLRGQQVVYVFAKAGQDIRADIRHLAGQRRAIALHYVLIDQAGERLRDETVAPSATESFSVIAPYTGTYALVVTGGLGGQAWYGVRIHNRHLGLRAPAYVFFMHPLDLYLWRTSNRGTATISLTTGRNQVVAAQLDKNAVRQGTRLRWHLPTDRKMFHLRLQRPKIIPDGDYVQDYMISVHGQVAPYLSDGPQRGLE